MTEEPAGGLHFLSPPWGGASAPGRDLRPRDRGQEPPTLLCPLPLAAQVWFLPPQPSAFHSSTGTGNRNAVGSAWLGLGGTPSVVQAET